MPRPPEYGILYNWDGAPHSFTEYPQTMEAFLDGMYAPMEDTQVGAHFWCIGEHTARYQSDVLETIGEAPDRRYPNAANYIFDENVRAMLDRGEDAQAEAIARGRELGMHVYVSVRMNDNHFGGAQPEDVPKMPHHKAITKMRREHLDWTLGDRAQSDWFALSWNMAVPEVREHRFRHVEELCRRWDWDGIELDWQRHGFHLDKELGYRLRYVLTDLQRSIRQMTNRLADERGKPFYVAARVSGTLEMCQRIGYDIPTWVEEGLVDILIPAASSGMEPQADVAGFKELVSGTDIAVYPCVYGSTMGTDSGPEDAATKLDWMTKGIAARHWAEGADGIYVFNYHGDRDSRRGTLTTMGAPDTLRRRSKIYAATHRGRLETGAWRGAAINDRIQAEVPVPLKRTMSGDGPSVTLMVTDDFTIAPPENVELRVRLDEWVKGDVVEVTLDGVALSDPTITYTDVMNRMGWKVSGTVWQSYTLSAAHVPAGNRKIKVILRERNALLESDIELTDVELVVRYAD